MKKTLIYIIVCFLAIAAIYYIRSFHEEIGAEPVRQSAANLLNQVGGAEKVCFEADQMFKKFGVSNLTIFLPSDLRNYPAIAALGRVDGIWPGDPPYIKISFGNHLTGYQIEIIDTNIPASMVTNDPAKYVTSSNLIDLAGSRIYVRR